MENVFIHTREGKRVIATVTQIIEHEELLSHNACEKYTRYDEETDRHVQGEKTTGLDGYTMYH